MQMFKISLETTKTWPNKFRLEFGKIMLELARQREDVVFVVSDSGRGCRCDGFDDCPEQFVECGIAEQNMIGVAAGLARCGKRPVAFGFAPFAAERCFEQIRVDVAYSNLNVIIVGSEGGFGFGTQGVTHFGWEDVALMRSLPGMTVLCPADNAQLVHCLQAALAIEGPVYIRTNGGIPTPLYQLNDSLEVGKGIVHRTGTDASIIVSGPLVAAACEASDALAQEGISVGVVNMHTIKPLDNALVLELAKKTKLIMTIEEHTIVNGLGSAVADVLSEEGCGCKLIKVGLPDEYPHTVSPYPIMLKDYGFTPESFAQKIKAGLKRGHEDEQKI